MSNGIRATLVGGPLAGGSAYSRFLSGFLLLDRFSDMVWIYDYDAANNRFVVRDEAGEPFDPTSALLNSGEFDLLSINSRPLTEKPAAPTKEMQA